MITRRRRGSKILAEDKQPGAAVRAFCTGIFVVAISGIWLVTGAVLPIPAD